MTPQHPIFLEFWPHQSKAKNSKKKKKNGNLLMILVTTFCTHLSEPNFEQTFASRCSVINLFRNNQDGYWASIKNKIYMPFRYLPGSIEYFEQRHGLVGSIKNVKA